MLLEIADFVIDVKNRYTYFNRLCEGYEAKEGSTPDFSVEVPEEILKKAINESPDFPDGYIESLEIYRIICKKILKHDAILLHSAAISVDNEGYLFTALSGTGKTTHISLWKKKFGDRCVIVNGDKPILRYKDGKFFVYGTPWCGKEGYSTNTSVPVKAICILERGVENSIKKIAAAEAIPSILTQTLRTNDLEEMADMLSVADKLLAKVQFYRLFCNMDQEAADVSYNAMSQG